MILGVTELFDLVREKHLVENLSERELENPEGAGFDFRIGTLYRLTGQGFLGVTERETPDIEKVASFDPEATATVVLEPHAYYVMKTAERVNVPDDLVALITPRSTLYRSGVMVFAGDVKPGYRGELNLGIMNLRDEPFVLEMGARVCHVMFHKVEGGTAPYRGQWQDGRTTTDTKETQV
ncbi:MAG: hypothetical protein HGB18_04790 [Candidatus Moranbacteria bacterium]|nr:hypothetical protein [Candidatus Moranbacteria bacterium]